MALKKRLSLSIVVIGFAALLQGCPLLILGGVAGGAMVVSDPRTVGTQADDREIQIRAKAQLIGDLPSSSHVDVVAYNRRVLLVGEVPDEDSKKLATAIVHAIVNVKGVVNELAIQGSASFMSRSNDTLITSKVKASIIGEENLSSNSFKVVTVRGIVYLMGLVTVEEGNRVTDIASRINGVTQVVKVFQYIKKDEFKAPLTPVDMSEPSANFNLNEQSHINTVPNVSITEKAIQ